MSINWKGRLRSRDNKPAFLLPRDGWQDVTGDQRRRVFVPSRRDGSVDSEAGTVWLCDDEGFARADRQPSPHDVVQA